MITTKETVEKLYDERGLPVSGVRIMIQGPGNKPDQIENVDFQTCPVTNREDGTWSCNYIPRDYKDEIRFILKKPGYAVTFPVVPVNRVDLTNLVLVINDGFSLSGQIKDLQNQPIVDARISTLDGDHSRRQSTQTDENGVFLLAGVPGGGGADVSYVSPPVRTNDSGGVVPVGEVVGELQPADARVDRLWRCGTRRLLDRVARRNHYDG